MYLDDFEQRSLSRLILSFFEAITTNPHIRYDIDRKQITPGLPIWVRVHCVNDAKSLVFVISGPIKNANESTI